MGTTGRVVFFADDIPENTFFITADDVSVHRIGKTVYIGNRILNL